MIDIEQFNDDHQNLLAIAQRLAATLDADALALDAWDARGLLSTLAGKLKVHLVLEDKFLYAALQNSLDENVRSISQQFSSEMGGIAEAFQAYIDRWPHAMAVEAQPQGFIDETRTILEILGERIQKEESILYPMASSDYENPRATISGASNSVRAA